MILDTVQRQPRTPNALPANGRSRRAAGLALLSLSGLGLASLLAPGAARAALLARGDALAVRRVVEDQLGAFAADDAERAFSYASTSIRDQFGDAATFLAMVQANYPMVVRPVTTTFFQAVSDAGTVLQTVQLSDRAGRRWLATYQLAQQAGAGWRILGCVVVADAGKSSI
jgi:hypothetical protein